MRGSGRLVLLFAFAAFVLAACGHESDQCNAATKTETLYSPLARSCIEREDY